MPKLLRHLAAVALLLAVSLASSPADDSPLPKNLHAELNPPAVAGVAVRHVRATSAEIEWPSSLSAARGFRVEVRRFSLGADRELKMEWVEFPGAVISRSGELQRARLSGLTPRQPYWVRVLPKDAGEPLFTVRFQTPAPVPVFTIRRTVFGGLGALLAGLLWLLWQRRRG